MAIASQANKRHADVNALNDGGYNEESQQPSAKILLQKPFSHSSKDDYVASDPFKKGSSTGSVDPDLNLTMHQDEQSNPLDLSMNSDGTSADAETSQDGLPTRNSKSSDDKSDQNKTTSIVTEESRKKAPRRPTMIDATDKVCEPGGTFSEKLAVPIETKVHNATMPVAQPGGSFQAKIAK